MIIKKTICWALLLAVIISATSPVFFALNKSYAAVVEAPYGGTIIGGYNQEIKNPCSFWNLFSRDCVLFGFANLVYFVIFRTTNFITFVGGVIFDASVAFSLSGEAFSTENNPMLEIGWKATRDLANLFFIFIILYIAIATILQLSGYGSKSLLVKVIIIALLINFSSLLTKVVIDASHVFAWEFYNSIDDSGGNQYVLEEPEIEVNLNKINNLAPAARKNLSLVFLAGFDPQKIIIGGKGFDEMAQMASKDGFFSIVWQIIVIYILASILNLVAAFIFFAGAVLFIIRIVVLWFVIILSPLAFVGMIMPGKMAGYAKSWWDALINQSFFAPAFLFLFYLVTVLINSDFLQNVIKAADSAPSAKIVGIDFGSTIIVIFHFVIIGGLMIFCLIIAKQMGAYGAQMTMDWGKAARGWAQGYAGYYSKRGAGLAAEELFLKRQTTKKGEETRFGRFMRRIPMANRGLARVSSWREKQMKEETKKAGKEFSSYSEAGISAVESTLDNKILGRNIIFSPTRKGFEETMAKKKDKETKREEYKTILSQLSGFKKEDIEKMLKQGELSKIEKEIEKIGKINTSIDEGIISGINDLINEIDTKLETARLELAKAVEAGVPDALLKLQETEINKLKKGKVQQIILKTQTEKDMKDREKLEDKKDKMERSNEFKNLDQASAE